MKTYRPLIPFYIIGFLISLHTALILYSNSSFLNQYIKEEYVGLLYSVGSVLTIIGLLLIPKAIARFGSKITMATLVLVTIAICITFAVSENSTAIIILFTILFAANTMFFLSNDIIIDQVADSDHMGSIRGSYLTALNIGYLIAPTVTGFVLARMGFDVLYIIACIILLPLLFVLLKTPSFRQIHASKAHIWKSLARLIKNRDIRNIVGANFLLQFFYCWMVIYTPIYLHETLQIPWDSVGSIFSIMLLAFVLTQIPLGRIADKYLGEKELLVGGFLFMGGCTLLLFFLPYFTLPLLALVFFGTRIGASCIEVLTETYFFKKVPKTETGAMSIFRNTYPLAYIIAPIIGSAVLAISNPKYLFLALGIICLFGVLWIIPIRDTK